MISSPLTVTAELQPLMLAVPADAGHFLAYDRWDEVLGPLVDPS